MPRLIDLTIVDSKSTQGRAKGTVGDLKLASYGRGLSPPWAAINAARTQVYYEMLVDAEMPGWYPYGSFWNIEDGKMSLQGKTLFITGASRGIGHAIGLRAARDGANIVIAAKTVTEHPKLPGTIHSAAADMEGAGGKALAIACDIRFEEQVQSALDKAAESFGGIDIVVNNASAINLSRTMDTDMKRYDLMHQVNARGTFLCSKLAIPCLKKAENPHILNLSPPLNMSQKWFAKWVAYTMAKYGMSMCTLGMSAEFKDDGIAVNSLWPESAIATAAVANLLGGEETLRSSRKADIVADAAYWILTQPSRECTGNFFIDVEVLARAGVTDFSEYDVEPGHKLARDFFLDESLTNTVGFFK